MVARAKVSPRVSLEGSSSANSASGTASSTDDEEFHDIDDEVQR